ncbi:hypothetical protein IB269_07645 [Delftia sp. DLF01]|uniref:hypothetical protein n=1 Tax=Delftia sp. DLF01 TaxID=2769279 RepID=UPI00177D53CD|nr:hypothetical protein [Delftia sp. DLF01]MBD9581243.1 hypothetical protein [Delftia sp. DLF01]
MQDRVKHNRKNTIWIIPFSIALLIFNVYLIHESTIPDIRDIFDLSPVIRVTPLFTLVITFWAIPLTMVVAVIANAIPLKKQVLKIFEYISIFSVGVNVISIAIAFLIIAPLHYYTMPKLGYTRCNILEDHPTIYFTDWVKNPAWCVRGKSREWVNEQSRLDSSTALNP